MESIVRPWDGGCFKAGEWPGGTEEAAPAASSQGEQQTPLADTALRGRWEVIGGKRIGSIIRGRLLLLRISPMPVPLAASRPPPLVSISERDLDLILLTAIHGSAAFRAALVKKLSGMVIAEFVGARRAVYGQEGETDLLVEVRTESGERLAITIQVRIDSSSS